MGKKNIKGNRYHGSQVYSHHSQFDSHAYYVLEIAYNFFISCQVGTCFGLFVLTPFYTFLKLVHNLSVSKVNTWVLVIQLLWAKGAFCLLSQNYEVHEF